MILEFDSHSPTLGGTASPPLFFYFVIAYGMVIFKKL